MKVKIYYWEECEKDFKQFNLPRGEEVELTLEMLTALSEVFDLKLENKPRTKGLVTKPSKEAPWKYIELSPKGRGFTQIG